MDGISAATNVVRYKRAKNRAVHQANWFQNLDARFFKYLWWQITEVCFLAADWIITYLEFADKRPLTATIFVVFSIEEHCV